MVSSVDRAKRALVSLLLHPAKLYRVVLDITRDSADGEMRKSFKKVSRKAHPDHGGSGEHQQTLNDTFSAWEQTKREAKGREQGRQRSTAEPSHGASDVLHPLRSHAEVKKDFRFQSAAVLLTYQKCETKSAWEDFVAHLLSNLVCGSIAYPLGRVVGGSHEYIFQSPAFLCFVGMCIGGGRRNKNRDSKLLFSSSGNLKIFEVTAAWTDEVARMKVPCIMNIRILVTLCW